MSKNKKYCVYIHTRERDGTPFYVGKGTKKRANSMSNRTQYWKRIASKYGRTVNIIGWLPEPCAFAMEKILIHKIGRENLCNMTNGGEGTSGRVANLEQRIKCSISNSGNSPSKKCIEASRVKNNKPVGTRCGLAFESVISAAKFANPSNPKAGKASISGCARGKTKKAYGYEWGFIENGEVVFIYKNRMSQPRPARHKPIKNDNGELFISVTSAVEWLRVNGYPKASTGGICANLKGRAKSSCGRVWSYV